MDYAPFREYSAVWAVYISRQSRCGSSNGGSIGGVNSHALRSGYGGSLCSRGSEGESWHVSRASQYSNV